MEMLAYLYSVDSQPHSFIKYRGCRDERDTRTVQESILQQMSQLMRRVVNLVEEVRKAIPSKETSVRHENILVCLEYCRWFQCD